MAWYDDITLLSQLQSYMLHPEATDAQTTLRLADIQTRKFLVSFLGVAHSDNGALKDGAAGAGSIAAGAVDTAALGPLAVTNAKLAADAVKNVNILSRTIEHDRIKLADLTNAEIANNTILGSNISVTNGVNIQEANLDTDSVTTTKIKNDAVTNDKIADGAIDAAAKIADGVVTAKKLLKSDTPGVYKVPVMAPTGTDNVEATIGGIVTATLVGSVLTFSATGSGLTNAANCCVLCDIASGTATALAVGSPLASWQARVGALSATFGTTDFVTVSGNAFTLIGSASFLVIARVAAYSVGSHTSVLVNNTTSAAQLYGSHAYAGPGQQSDSFIIGVISQTASTEYQVRQWFELTHATYGLGLPSGVSAATPSFMTILCVKLV